MLPDVGSTIVPPRRSSPSRSAASIIATATRSLIEPPGLRYSTFATTCGVSPAASRDSRTSGVRPTASRIESSICWPAGAGCCAWAMGVNSTAAARRAARGGSQPVRAGRTVFIRRLRTTWTVVCVSSGADRRAGVRPTSTGGVSMTQRTTSTSETERPRTRRLPRHVRRGGRLRGGARDRARRLGADRQQPARRARRDARPDRPGAAEHGLRPARRRQRRPRWRRLHGARRDRPVFDLPHRPPRQGPRRPERPGARQGPGEDPDPARHARVALDLPLLSLSDLQ